MPPEQTKTPPADLPGPCAPHPLSACLSSISLPAAPALLCEAQATHGRASPCSCWCCKDSISILGRCCPGPDHIGGASCCLHPRHPQFHLHHRHAVCASHCCPDPPWIQQLQHHHPPPPPSFDPISRHVHGRHSCRASASCSFVAPTLFVICPHCLCLIPYSYPFPHASPSEPYATLHCGHCLKLSKFSTSHLHQPASELVGNLSRSNAEFPGRFSPEFDGFSRDISGEIRRLNSEYMSLKSSVPCENGSSIIMALKVEEEYDDRINIASEFNCKVRLQTEEDVKDRLHDSRKFGAHDTSSDGRRVGCEAVNFGRSSSHGVGLPCRNRARLSDFLFTGEKPHSSSADATHDCARDQTMLRPESSASGLGCSSNRIQMNDAFTRVQSHDPPNVVVNDRTPNLVPGKWNSIKGEDREHHSNVNGNRGDDHCSNVNGNSRDFPNWDTVQDWVNSIDIEGFVQEDEMAYASSPHEDARNSHSVDDRGIQKSCAPAKFQVHSSDHVQGGDEGKEDQRSVSEKFFRRLALKEYKRDGNNSSKRRVIVNGHILSSTAVKKAEERAGRLRPGSYWYDSKAGFWGVMEGPCLGMLPPSINELNYPMSKHCSNGTTEVYVNGRELHEKDLEVLAKRGLPKTPGGMYILGFDGVLIDETSGKELQKLGKLAPTVERRGRGFGMFAGNSQITSRAL